MIRPIDDPIGPGPAIAILQGSFADTAVVRLGIRDGSRPEEFTGPARVFESSLDCLQAIEDGVVQPGDVVVARNQGLKGGPAMGGGGQPGAVRARRRRPRQDHRLRHRRPALGPVPQGPDRGRSRARSRDRRPDRQGAATATGSRSASPTARSTSTCPPTELAAPRRRPATSPQRPATSPTSARTCSR